MDYKDIAMAFSHPGKVPCHILKEKIPTQRSTEEKIFKKCKLNRSSNTKHKDICCQGLKNVFSPFARGDSVALAGTNMSWSHHTCLHFLDLTFKITTKINQKPKPGLSKLTQIWGFPPLFSFMKHTHRLAQSLALSEALFYNHSRKAEDVLQTRLPTRPQPFLYLFVSFNSKSRKELHTALRMNNCINKIAGNTHIWDKSKLQPDSCLKHVR